MHFRWYPSRGHRGKRKNPREESHCPKEDLDVQERSEVRKKIQGLPSGWKEKPMKTL